MGVHKKMVATAIICFTTLFIKIKHIEKSLLEGPAKIAIITLRRGIILSVSSVSQVLKLTLCDEHLIP